MIERRITGFRRGDDGDWVADLDCGHARHVRHDPPWHVHPWITTSLERDQRIGAMLLCGHCTREDAAMRGLCEDGVDEIDRSR